MPEWPWPFKSKSGGGLGLAWRFIWPPGYWNPIKVGSWL